MKIKEKLVSVIFALLLCAMVFSSFMQSVCMMTLIILGFLDFHTSANGTKISVTLRPFKRLKQFSKYSHFLVITLYFWIVLFSFWQVESDSSYLLERLRIKVPFLLIPIAYLGLPKLSKLSFHRILYYFLTMMSITVAGVLVLYLANFEQVNLLLKQGQHIATPCNHIRFSLLVGLSVLSGWYLIKESSNVSNGIHGSIIKGLTVFLFLSIHILSVKTGVICLYVALFVLATKYIYTTRNYIVGASGLAVMIILPFLAYKTIPSFNEKVHYTLYDLQMYTEGQGSNYGDSGRITSFKVGLGLFKESPVFGVGAGNLRSQVSNVFANEHPQYAKSLMPHSQFVFVLAGSGIFGISLFMMALFVPFFYRKAYRNDFFLGFYILFLSSFIIDFTIESALGVGIFSSFMLMSLLYVHNDTHDNEIYN